MTDATKVSAEQRAFLEKIKGLSHKQSLLLCWELQKRLDQQQKEAASAAEKAVAEQPLAIIGMGCRFPGGSDSLQAFWQSLLTGRESVREVPKDRWDLDLWYDPDPATPERIACRRGGFLDQVDGFDADFFGLSAREALSMDPQQRLLLEVAWSALENAGIPPGSLKGKKVGVFVGISTNDYADLLQRDSGADLDSYFLSGNALNFAAGRIAYTLGLEGPSLAVDTACSSSLVALHLAEQALKLGDCDLALVGGVNLLLSPFSTLVASRARMLSPTGYCRAFDVGADGMVRGEGCGVVVLKPLATAQNDGNRIWSVLQGSAVNQDGASSGITVPNRRAQEAVVRQAQARAGVKPADVGFVEAHGTGTPLGDPIEAHGLGSVFRASGERFLLGSVKTNLGHLESAAGMAGLIKTVLALNEGLIPPHLHLDQPNPAIQWDQVPADIPREKTVFPERAKGRVAGVSSFGGSGTNAHVILSQAPSATGEATVEEPVSASPLRLLPLSAKSAGALATMTAGTGRICATEQAVMDPQALARTAAFGRDHFAFRQLAIGKTAQELSDAFSQAQPSAKAFKSKAGPVFLFTGQGSQYLGMAGGLYAEEPVFRQTFDRLAARLDPQLPQPLSAMLFDAQGDESEALLNRTDVTQPALFALQLSLVALWESWGIKPSAVAGHSLGAFAAAVVAGVMTEAVAADLVLARGRLVEELCPKGRMLALQKGAAETESYLTSLPADLQTELSISALNGPEETVVTGSSQAVEALQTQLEKAGETARLLTGHYGFHSPLVAPALDGFEAALQGKELSNPVLPFVCTLSGHIEKEAVARKDYWLRQLREPVNFLGAVQSLLESGQQRFLEIGPGGILSALTRRTASERDVLVVPSLRKGRPDGLVMRQALAGLYGSGLDPDWRALMGFGPFSEHLPGYAFDRRRFWPDTDPPKPKDHQDTLAESGPSAASYHFTWQALPSPESAEIPPGRWLVLGEEPTLIAALTQQLVAAGAQVVCYPNTAALLAKPETLAQPLTAILDLQPLSQPGLEDVKDWQAAAERTSLLHLPEFLTALQERTEATNFWQITAGGAPRGRECASGMALPDAEGPDPLQALYWPFLRGAELEQEEDRLGLLDLPRSWRELDAEELATKLLALTCLQGEERQLALTSDGGLALRLQRLEPAEAAVHQNTADIESDGLYLVAGGTGGLGRALSRWLVEQGARHLLLLGRRPADRSLDGWLMSLRSLGADVEYLACDLGTQTCPAQLEEALADRPPLRGIVHAAGSAVSAPSSHLKPEQWQMLFQAKLAGLQQLDALSRQHSPSLFLLCSSAAATWGSLGLSAYGAVNGFLDALAERRQAAGLPGLSIAWGPWQGTGMNVKDAAEAFAAGGVASLPPDSALARLDELCVAGEQGAVTVASVDWARFAPLYEARRSRSLLALLKSAAGTGVTREPAARNTEAAGNKLDPWLALSQADQQRELEAFLLSALAQVQGELQDEMSKDDNLALEIADLGLDSLMVMDLLGFCRQSYGIVLYPKDFFEQSSLYGFAAFLAQELRRLHPAGSVDKQVSTTARSVPVVADRQTAPDAVFLLSSPRSGSTLARVMLAGHPGLFSPPELHLLGYDSLKPWHAALSGNYLDEGLLRAIMDRFGLSADEAEDKLAQWVQQDRAVADVYQELGQGGRLLVDKSPSYLTSLDTLQRAEELFSRPLYLHLVRHPLSVIESFVRNRLDRFMEGADDPHAFAEQHWRAQNQNMERFAASLPADRCHRLRYEDLVADPKGVMSRVMDFLGLPFDDRLLQPYEGQRMTDGPKTTSLQIGDPNFLRHQGIEADLARSWEAVELPGPLAPETVTLARSYGYDLPEAALPAGLSSEDDGLEDQLKGHQETLQAHPKAADLRAFLRDQGLGQQTWRTLQLGARWTGAAEGAGAPDLVLPLRDSKGKLKGFQSLGKTDGQPPLEGPLDVPLDVPLGLDRAAETLNREGYGLILGDPLLWMKAQQAGVAQALLGPLTPAGRQALEGQGTAFFDLSGEAGNLDYISPMVSSVASQPQLKGRYEELSLSSDVLGQDVAVALLRPEQPQDDLPLVLFLPGAEAELSPRLAALPDQMMADGDLPALAIAWFQAPRSLYLDPPAGGPRWETFLVQELPALLRRHSQKEVSDGPFGLLGLSMGGLGALRMALRHADRVRAVSALAPALEAGLTFADIEETHPLSLLRPTGYLEGFFGAGIDDKGQWQAHHPTALAAQQAARLKKGGLAMQVICGEQDSLAWDGSLYLHKLLESEAVPHDFQRLPKGRHDPAFFALTVPEGLAFVAQALVSDRALSK
ncbi:SDR family NAD(P)-dependent oxidoreductase [Rhodovibrionaceae bacterium A322]